MAERARKAFFKNYLPDLCIGLGTGVLGVYGAVGALTSEVVSWTNAVFVAGVIIFGLGYILHFGRDRKVTTIQERLDATEQELEATKEKLSAVAGQAQQLTDIEEAHLQKLLHKILKHAGCWDSDTRVSLYRHDSTFFSILARRSNNPKLQEKNRPIYPIEGCLEHAWNSSFSWHPTLPDPEKDEATYLEYMESKCGLPRNTMVKIRMKSRSLYAHRVDQDSKWLGVLMFESLKPGRLDKNRLTGSICKYQKDLCEHLNTIGKTPFHLPPLGQEGK